MLTSVFKKRSIVGIRQVGGILAIVAFALPFFVEFDGLSPEGHRILAVFLMAIVLWVTEAIPLHATAALIILLEILLISDQALVSTGVDFDAPTYGSFFSALSHPVLMLFLGGFFLADGAAKFNLDRNLARVMLRPFGTSPRGILLGLMLVTAAFSMFMSNTATTATLMAVILPVVAGLPAEDRFRTGLALSIPIAANVGGIGTPVGTPPNAIAVGSLAEAGISISFLDWMALAVPPMLLTLVAAWWLLVRFYPATVEKVSLGITGSFDRSLKANIFTVVFAVTVLLWLTEPIHGIPSAIVGFMPVVVLLAVGVMSTKDLQSIQWHVLWLVAGGIALGAGVAQTGVDVWLVGHVEWGDFGSTLVVILLAVVTLALSTVISNSATANLMVPIGLSLAASSAVDVGVTRAAFFIAIGASLAMALPISTPPNAIAYSTGVVQTRDLAFSGIVIGAIGIVLYLVLAPLLWQAMGAPA